MTSRYTNSQITADSECPALTYFKKICGWKPNRLNINLEYGSAVHTGFETYFRHIKDGRDKSIAREAAIEAFIEYFSPLDLEYHKQKNLQTGEKALSKFINLDHTRSENVIDVEFIKDKKIYYKDEEFIYGGKIDLILGNKGLITVVDHKTVGVGQYSTYTHRKWAMSRQLIGYSWLNHTNLIHVNVVHCKMEPEIHIEPFAFSPVKMERWEVNTIGLIKRLDDRIRQYQYWEKNQGLKGVITPEELFPRIASNCMTQSWDCPFENPCRQDCDIQDIIVSPVDYALMTEEERLL